MNLGEKIESIIGAADNKFFAVVRITQQDLYENLIDLFKKLEVSSDGYILNNASNRALLTKSSQVFNQTINNSGYNEAVNEFVGTFSQIDLANQDYFSTISDLFKPNRLFITSLQNQTISALESAILNEGLAANIKSPLMNIISQNINSGGSYSGFLEQLRSNIIGMENEGKLLRYSRGILNDALFNYSRAYQQSVTNDLGLEFYLYSGGLTKDSREFCAEHSDEFYHQNEIEAWANETWQGQVAGTTSSSIFIFAGGYNCKHSIIPVDISIVPQDVIQRNIESGNYIP